MWYFKEHLFQHIGRITMSLARNRISLLLFLTGQRGAIEHVDNDEGKIAGQCGFSTFKRDPKN